MANEMVVVIKGHQRSFKVIIQGHFKYEGDLTKKNDQVCVWYYWKCYLSDRGSLIMDIEMLAVARGIGHQR